jgi:hypothetical protein
VTVDEVAPKPAWRSKTVRWTIVVLALSIAMATCVMRGLSPWEVEARVAEVVRANPDGTEQQLVRAISDEFADDGPRYSASDGAAFSPVSRSGISGTPIVRRVAEDDVVRVAVAYAEAPVIPSGWGDMYCLVIDVPAKGAPHRRTVQADFTTGDLCAHAHDEVADR